MRAGHDRLVTLRPVATRGAAGVPLTWIFSIEGLADFANAFFQGAAAAVAENPTARS